MAQVTFVTGLKELLDSTVLYLTHDIRAMLVGTGYTPNVDDLFASTPAAHEISVSGYTPGFSGTGRKSLAGKSITANLANNRVQIDANDVTWTSLGAGATVRWLVVYRHNTTDANSRILWALQLPADTPTDGSNFVWQVAAAGIAVAF